LREGEKSIKGREHSRPFVFFFVDGMVFSAGSSDSFCPVSGHISNALEKSRYGDVFIQFLSDLCP
jgi:hypothetical protein